MVETADVVIIGGGIAGVSIGWELAASGMKVHLVEAEDSLAYHTTGRSAAQYLESYGNSLVRRLTIASRTFFDQPPQDLVDGPLWHSRSMMQVGGPEHVEMLRAQATNAQRLVPSVEFIDAAQAMELFPVLRPEMVAGAFIEPDAMELDVAAIHQTFVRGMRKHGATISLASPVTGLRRDASGGWHVQTATSTLSVPVVVNAAGSWCDQIAVLAGAQPVGLHPLRRTVAVAALPDGVTDSDRWPLVSFEADNGAMAGYCKPEPGGLLVSPADETPSEPCDARPEEIDVARGLDTVGRWTTLELRHVRSTWAGLRTFASDRSFVVGMAPDAPGFFWLAGQGGYGIQTAPGLARAAASILQTGALPDDLAATGLSLDQLAPDRPGLQGSIAAEH